MSTTQLEDLTFTQDHEQLIQTIKSECNQDFICVFCGSREGNSIKYKQTAIELGKQIALRGYGIVYGGGNDGLMGLVAKSVYDNGGKVISVYPVGFKEFCKIDFGYKNILVKDMHSRKKMMARLSKAFLTLPGGLGTFEEVMEMATWNSLSIHNKYLGVVNVHNYFDNLKMLLDHSIKEGFTSQSSIDLIRVDSDINVLLDEIDKFEAHDYKTPYIWD